RLELKALKDGNDYKNPYKEDSDNYKNFEEGQSDAYAYADTRNREWDALETELECQRESLNYIYEGLDEIDNAYWVIGESDLPKKIKDKLKKMYKSPIIDVRRTQKSIDIVMDYLNKNKPYPEV